MYLTQSGVFKKKPYEQFLVSLANEVLSIFISEKSQI